MKTPICRPVPTAAFVLILFLGSALHAQAVRTTYNFNPGWKLFVGDPAKAQATDFDDSAWTPVTLPRAWNEDEAFKKDIRNHSTGIVWYRKSFVLPAESKDNKVFLEFEGVRQAGEFYLNGKHLGRHENGIMAVGLDVSDYVRPAPEQNVVAVRVDNSWEYREQSTGQRYQWADRNFNANYGGLTKNVRLHIAGRIYQTLPLYSNLGTTGVYIYGRDFDIPNRSAAVCIESQVRNELPSAQQISCDVKIENSEGQIVGEFSGDPIEIQPGETTIVKASARVQNLSFWSWGYGYLYTVTTTLKSAGQAIDSVQTRTGFRKTEFANGVVKLNDRVIQIHGYAQRTSNEWPAVGASVPPWLSDFSNRLMVEGGGNLVRWMHITPWKQDVESCDRVGLIQAMPAGDSEADVTGTRWDQRVAVLRDAIIYNRNNPSIVFYECGNKGISEAHMAQMKALRDRFDPHGGRAIGAREMLDSQTAEYGGEMLYINKSARLPFWATEYSRDEALRRYWDDFSPPFHKDGDGPLYNGQDARIYNRNQDSQAIEDVVRWYDYWRERPGTGARVSSGGVNIIFSDTNTHHRGESNYRCSGEVDAMRIPKDSFFAHQVMWDGWVDVEQPRAHIVGHWNYKDGVKKNIYVVSSADEVKLFLNDELLGVGKQSNRFLFTFADVPWKSGKLRAVGFATNGKSVCEASVETATEPAALKLRLMTGPGGMKADGADLALIEVEVVDAQGRRCPTAFNAVDFKLSGPAQWRGGIAQGKDNYILSEHLPVECGVNRVLVRSTTTAGPITIAASSQGLSPATLEFTSKPVASQDGLAAVLPADGLPSFTDRGPTPSSPSFKATRTPVAIVRATAGSNADRAALSHDDNERTAWANDNRLANSWIEFDFGRQVTLTEATLKLTGWRQRSYPVSITVDGTEVFRGLTPKSLGYVTLPLKASAGRSLRISLIKPSTIQDAFKIEELGNNKENASTGADRVGNETLSIIEAEFYEAEPREAVANDKAASHNARTSSVGE